MIHKILYRRVIIITLLVCLLSVAFFWFFNTSKHDPTLSKANVFLDDPYDAVGSFGLQLAGAAALLALLRCLQPYPQGITLERLGLILRADLVAVLAVGVTINADAAALLHYHSLWMSSPSNWTLLLLLGGLLMMTVLCGWGVLNLGRSTQLLIENQSWIKTILVVLVGWLVLAVYPEAWRASIPGEVFTVLVGMTFLFILCSVLAQRIFPPSQEEYKDLMDDFMVFYNWLSDHARFAKFLFQAIKKIIHQNWIQACWKWLNPRKHGWRGVILTAVLLGLGLFSLEMLGEGLPQAHLVFLVLGVYTGLEACGVLMGFAIFKDYLGILRSDPSEKRG